jgi:hypothetical protein
MRRPAPLPQRRTQAAFYGAYLDRERGRGTSPNSVDARESFETPRARGLRLRRPTERAARLYCRRRTGGPQGHLIEPPRIPLRRRNQCKETRLVVANTAPALRDDLGGGHVHIGIVSGKAFPSRPRTLRSSHPTNRELLFASEQTASATGVPTSDWFACDALPCGGHAFDRSNQSLKRTRLAQDALRT